MDGIFNPISIYPITTMGDIVWTITFYDLTKFIYQKLSYEGSNFMPIEEVMRYFWNKLRMKKVQVKIKFY